MRMTIYRWQQSSYATTALRATIHAIHPYRKRSNILKQPPNRYVLDDDHWLPVMRIDSVGSSEHAIDVAQNRGLQTETDCSQTNQNH